MTDPIADMLSRIRNAQAVHKPEVMIPYSNVKFAIAQILEQLGYVKKADRVPRAGTGVAYDQLRVVLKYQGKEPAITSINRISKPGHRVYVAKDKLPIVLNNIGVAIISTSHGIMTNKDAKKKSLGGEVICEIY